MKTLHQPKFQKYNSLKYKPTPTEKVKKIAAETGNTENSTYAEVTHADRNPTRRLCKTNNVNNNKTYMKNYTQQVQQAISEDKETI